MYRKLSIVFAACLFGLTFAGSAQAADGEISPAEVKAKVKAGALLIDVRDAEAFQKGHVDGAINVPHEKLVSRLDEMKTAKDKPVVVYGRRSAAAKETLVKSGYKQVFNGGGYKELAGG